MRRASNPRTPAQKPRQANAGGTLVGVFLGLVLGVSIAAALAWYFSRPYQFSQPQNNRLPPATQSATGSEPVALPAKPGDKPGTQPVRAGEGEEKKFDFYEILQKGNEGALPPPPDTEKKPAGNPPPPDQLYLQLGAFSDPSDADNLKARLALMGVEASVQRVDDPAKGALNRVRAGPYLSPAEMDNMRSQLAKLGIESTVVKVKSH